MQHKYVLIVENNKHATQKEGNTFVLVAMQTPVIHLTSWSNIQEEASVQTCTMYRVYKVQLRDIGVLNTAKKPVGFEALLRQQILLKRGL